MGALWHHSGGGGGGGICRVTVDYVFSDCGKLVMNSVVVAQSFEKRPFRRCWFHYGRGLNGDCI